MDFIDFINESKKDIGRKEERDRQKNGDQKAFNVDDRNIALWIGYKTIKSNKWLIRATWFLAISAIILAIISLFVK